MCGIVGKVTPRHREGPERELIERMCIALEHRGPDSRGVFADADAGLGIQRLRVVDLVTGDQPIYSEDGSIVVVMNGEIYNFQELRRSLRQRGHQFATEGDTEVIVHLYEDHGVDFVRHLQGMFAIALWDKRRRRLVLARDRIGKKPLFYSHSPSGLSFASELGALIQDQDVPRDIDPNAVDCFLAYGYVPAPLSIFSGVRKLPPAHTLVLENGSVSLERYWTLDYAGKLDVSDPRELHERILNELEAATKRRLIADVPLGAFLSGGIDSSAVVAAMARVTSTPVKTFSIGFTDDSFNELEHARRIAEQFGTDHHEFVVRPDAIAVVPKMVRHYGEPFADSSAIPCFYLSEMTRRHVTVALNGDGGDEAFGGYTRYVANRVASRLDRVPMSIRRAAAARAGQSGDGKLTSLANKSRRLLHGLALDPPARYASYMAWLGATQRSELYQPDFARLVDASVAPEIIAGPWREASGSDIVDVMLEVDTSTYLPGDLIPKIDISTMAYALEARSPFLDHQMLEFAASIPAHLKVHGREKKWILREALRRWLPGEILDRPKQGFSVPVGSWMRNELRDVVRDVLLDPGAIGRGYFKQETVQSIIDRHAAGADQQTKPLWALLMLELWHREFVDGSLPVDVLEAVG